MLVTIFPSYGENGYRVHFFGDEIEEIEAIDIVNNTVIERFKNLTIYPSCKPFCDLARCITKCHSSNSG